MDLALRLLRDQAKFLVHVSPTLAEVTSSVAEQIADELEEQTIVSRTA